MARCAVDTCGRWCPDVLVRRGVGTSVDDQWFCSRACIEEMARRRLTGTPAPSPGLPPVPRPRLGAVLRAQGSCGEAVLQAALEAQRTTGLRLGEQLRAMGALDTGAVLRALAAQFGTRCLAAVDVERVRTAPGGLTADAVRALGVVPLGEPGEDRIRVACAAPVPHRALAAFRRLTGWTPEVYLVSDDDWRALLDHYGADAAGASRHRPQLEFVRTTSVSDAASRIAAAVARGRAARVIDARWDGYAWVRIQAPDRVEDVCLLAGARANHQEVAWLAGTTPH
jgi:hypothetical protein